MPFIRDSYEIEAIGIRNSILVVNQFMEVLIFDMTGKTWSKLVKLPIMMQNKPALVKVAEKVVYCFCEEANFGPVLNVLALDFDKLNHGWQEYNINLDTGCRRAYR